MNLTVTSGTDGASGAGAVIPARLIESVRARRPGVDPSALIALGWADARDKLERYIDAGLSKFVVRPGGEVATASGLDEFLDQFATEILPLQT